jgi:predicted regulator of Ras-like GTPase activity (Roadblock/LC7/MglB family)
MTITQTPSSPVHTALHGAHTPAAPSAAAQNFGWLLDNFVDHTHGVLYAAAVSADGILVAGSDGLHRASAEQLAAIVAGLTSLANGADRCFNANGLEQIILEFGHGFLFVTVMGLGASLCVVASKDCEMGLVAYEMALLVERAAAVLTPELVAEMTNLLTVA